MLEVKFKYKNKGYKEPWIIQTCLCYSIAELKELYRLGKDFDYEILQVEKKYGIKK